MVDKTSCEPLECPSDNESIYEYNFQSTISTISEVSDYDNSWLQPLEVIVEEVDMGNVLVEDIIVTVNEIENHEFDNNTNADDSSEINFIAQYCIAGFLILLIFCIGRYILSCGHKRTKYLSSKPKKHRNISILQSIKATVDSISQVDPLLIFRDKYFLHTLIEDVKVLREGIKLQCSNSLNNDCNDILNSIQYTESIHILDKFIRELREILNEFDVSQPIHRNFFSVANQFDISELLVIREIQDQFDVIDTIISQIKRINEEVKYASTQFFLEEALMSLDKAIRENEV